MGIQELRVLKGSKKISETDKLSEMDRQFESIMVRMMLKDAFKDIKGYDYFVTDVLADSITSRERLFGINYSSQIKQLSNPQQ
ncbi:MAG: hypothetical protein COY94_06305 [Verrucomicrobia bacterium CG_4_10_14_0_8_um_filter_43_34]|nr:MAG: hypothetical protein COY94_06305 [Verrucomicrobia bacterium CG_4_10_14_0_8_um_filter_43_34]